LLPLQGGPGREVLPGLVVGCRSLLCHGVTTLHARVWKLPARVHGDQMTLAPKETTATWFNGAGEFNLSTFGTNYKLHKWLAGTNPNSVAAPNIRRVLIAEFAAASEYGDRPRLLHLACCKNVPLAMVNQLMAPRAQRDWVCGAPAASSGGWGPDPRQPRSRWN
jgi:hypothetical protein